MRKLAAGLAAALVAAPAALLLMIGVLVNPAASACSTGSGLSVGSVPDSLTASTESGMAVKLGRTQLAHAATIITVGGQVSGVGRRGILIALMAALTESSLRMLANTTAYPESANYPNDGNGHDQDSLGLFQMRPQSGWGTVAELMDPIYQAKAFYGGPTGPHYPFPRGLLDIPAWQTMQLGSAAQAAEVSAHPNRYQNYQNVAEAILTALTTSSRPAADTAPPGLPEVARIVFPLPAGTWVTTDGFGPRTDPITGHASFHPGTDYAAPAGTPILAIAAGRVTMAGPAAGYGNLIVIDHAIAGKIIASAYGHMEPGHIYVSVGDLVTAGQRIADVGTAGHSTGPHLHFEIRPGGTNATPVDSNAWLKTQHTEAITAAGDAPELCTADGSPT